MFKVEVAVLRQSVRSTSAPALIMRVPIPPRSPSPYRLLPSQVTCPHVTACRHMRRCIPMRLFQHIRTLLLHSTPLPFTPRGRTRTLRKTRLLHRGQNRKNRQNINLRYWMPANLIVWARMRMHRHLHRTAALIASRWPSPMHYHMGFDGQAVRIAESVEVKPILGAAPPRHHLTPPSPIWCLRLWRRVPWILPLRRPNRHSCCLRIPVRPTPLRPLPRNRATYPRSPRRYCRTRSTPTRRKRVYTTSPL